MYASAGNTSTLTGASYADSHTGALNDVTSGSNGSRGGSYLCTAGAGYDGPTGLGTPDGTGAFSPRRDPGDGGRRHPPATARPLADPVAS